VKRVTSRKNVLRKAGARKKTTRNLPQADGGYRGPHRTMYQEIVSRNGNARVCVIRSVGGIGDVLMTTPSMMQIKKDFPEVHITYAVDRHRSGVSDIYYQLVRNAPFIDEIIDARFVDRTKYDSVVDISAVCIRYERSGLPAINRIDLFARALGIPRLKVKLPFYEVDATEKLWAQLQLKKHNGKKLMVLHTASFEDKRSWTVKNQVGLLKHLQKNCPDVHVIVFDYNRKLGGVSAFGNCTDMSKFSIREKAAIIQQADLFLGPDSGLMHLAAAIQTTSFVIFGSVPPSARINYYPTHRSIRLDGLSCLGCWYKPCPINIKCMKDLTAQMVYARIKHSLILEDK
jgi:ADP-heptose:LPS heptosyltransferase